MKVKVNITPKRKVYNKKRNINDYFFINKLKRKTL